MTGVCRITGVGDRPFNPQKRHLWVIVRGMTGKVGLVRGEVGVGVTGREKVEAINGGMTSHPPVIPAKAGI